MNRKPKVETNTANDSSALRIDQSIRVLFIEDDSVYFSLMKRIFHSVPDTSFDIHWAPTLHQGLAILKKEDVDIILLDLMLPDSGGLATFERVRQEARGIPIVVLSAVKDEKQSMQAVYLGAQDFLIKSEIGVQSLVRCIKYTLARLQVAEYRERLQAITDFTAALAHDLRGPLIGASRVLTSLLADQALQLPGHVTDTLNTLKNSNDLLRSKVDTLLEIYRLECETARFEVEPVDIELLIKQCVQAFAASTGRHQIVCHLSQPVTTMGHRTLLAQLLSNLVDNAIKFNPAGVNIEISARKTSKGVKIVVKDHGVGMSEEDVHTLFKRFWRGGHDSHHVPATGLGLYLCEKIVRAHSGTISCRSKLGVGTTVVVTLPLSTQATQSKSVAKLKRVH